MFNVLDTALKRILDSADAPVLVRDADISFDRPSDTFTHDKTTIGIFLYDIRENTELRSSEPFIERANGVATIKKPPIRLTCSYLVTAWIGADATGEAAILKQHELLGEVLRVFAGMPTLPAQMLTGSLAAQPYPIPLVTLQSELMRNPAEFWSALGGKLRPSFTLTATVALEPLTAAITAPQVEARLLLINTVRGTVRSAADGEPLAGVELTIASQGLRTLSDADGHYAFSGLAAGGYSIAAAKVGYSGVDQPIQVPRNSPTAFDITLTATTP